MKHNKYILFNNGVKARDRIAGYFEHIKGQYHTELLPFKASAKSPPEMREQKVWDREPEPPTLSGLALFLGFDSLQSFMDYEQNGRFGRVLKRARLQIEAEYEKQLSTQPATGAIFALKSLGWMERQAEKDSHALTNTSLKIEIMVCGPAPALSEQEVAV